MCTVHLFWFCFCPFHFKLFFEAKEICLLFIFVSVVDFLHGCDLSECVLDLCGYGCYISDLNIFNFRYFWGFFSFLFSVAFSIVFVHLWCLMRLLHAGKTKDKEGESWSAWSKGSCLTSLLLSVCLSFPVCLPEWIHPPAYRCPLWQRQCGHTPAEQRGSSGLHGKGRIPH